MEFVEAAEFDPDAGFHCCMNKECGKPLAGDAFGYALEEGGAVLICPECDKVFEQEYEPFPDPRDGGVWGNRFRKRQGG